MTGTIETDSGDGITTITLLNEGKRNAISYGMMAEIIDAMAELADREGDQVVIFEGAGEYAFSAGFDLDQDRHEDNGHLWQEMNDAVEAHDYPTIAKLNGDTYGGAFELAASCDIRLGRRGATFGITPAKIGVVYGPRAITRVMNVIGPAKTKELLYTGNAIDAEHAREIGFLNYLLDDDATLDEKTREMAETISGNAPLSLKGMNTIIDSILANRSLSDAEVELGHTIRMEAFQSRDYEEGVEAFSENRDPAFEGR